MVGKIITVSNVSVILKKQTIFKELAFSCSSGEVIGITGPNGSGKSVFF